jgi:hypothetical protein
MTPFFRRHSLVKLVVFNALAVLAYDTFRPQPARGETEPAVATRRASRVPVIETAWRIADADLDIGPGNAEPALCQHGE